MEKPENEKRNLQTSWGYLPRSFYARTHGWPPPRHLAIYHANYTKGRDGVGQKLAQFREIDWVVRSGWFAWLLSMLRRIQAGFSIWTPKTTDITPEMSAHQPLWLHSDILTNVGITSKKMPEPNCGLVGGVASRKRETLPILDVAFDCERHMARDPKHPDAKDRPVGTVVLPGPLG